MPELKTSAQNVADNVAKLEEEREIRDAVSKMKSVDWKFLLAMSAPFVFVGAVLLAVALS